MSALETGWQPLDSRDDQLARLAGALMRPLDQRSAASFIIGEVASLPAVAYASLSLRRGSGLVEVASSGPVPARASTSALAKRATSGDFLTHASAEELDELGSCAAALARPLRDDRGELFGVLLVGVASDDEPELGPRVIALAKLGCALLLNERRAAASAAEARRDPLTALGNRRAFEGRIEQALAACALSGNPLSFVFCDLDDFKGVNERSGYRAGDRILREVARVLAGNLRPDEEVFRLGGDEFAVLLNGGAGAGTVVAERLAAALAARRRGPRLPTLSAGVASFPRDGRTAGALLEHADRQLALAKAARKRQLVAADIPAGRADHSPHPWSAAALADSKRTRPLHVLVVDDDPGLRLLLRTTFELVDVAVEEAESVPEAQAAIARCRPDAIVLDVALPGIDGLAFARVLKADPETRPIGILLLTGGELPSETARAVGAALLLRKPFSPLELLAAVERIGQGSASPARLAPAAEGPQDQLLLYASDLRTLLETERRQRRALEHTYRETLDALASALESKDTGTSDHSLRVSRYATELARAAAPELLADASLGYGFLLHDIGKIGIPDQILQKPGPLTPGERQIIETHAPLGAHILGHVALLHGEGLAVVRHHHERWDGQGYPDALAEAAIPLGARIFAVADALDAITSRRPYRPARSWDEAVAEIDAGAGGQFDPTIVEAFHKHERSLRRHHQLVAA
jgi:ribonuclease P protein subunit RPR2